MPVRAHPERRVVAGAERHHSTVVLLENAEICGLQDRHIVRSAAQARTQQSALGSSRPDVAEESAEERGLRDRWMPKAVGAAHCGRGQVAWQCVHERKRRALGTRHAPIRRGADCLLRPRHTILQSPPRGGAASPLRRSRCHLAAVQSKPPSAMQAASAREPRSAGSAKDIGEAQLIAKSKDSE